MLLTAALVMVFSASPALGQDASGVGVQRHPDQWLLRDTPSGGPATTSFRYGVSFDGSHMMCDWNGDGQRTPGVNRFSSADSRRWLLQDSLRGGSADHDFVYGRATDRPICGDWNGDGRQTPGVVRTDAEGRLTWFLKNSLEGGSADLEFKYGRRLMETTVPVVGDWNGDGIDTPGVVHISWRLQEPNRWQLRNSNNGGVADLDFRYGRASHAFVGDWNGDGQVGIGVRGGSRWFLRNDVSGGNADVEFHYGRVYDHPFVW